MTIFEDVPGIEVAVRIEGADAVEYEAPDAGDRDALFPTVTKYIECVDDAHFSVWIKVDDDYDWRYRGHSLKIQLFVDGRRAESEVWSGPFESEIWGERSAERAQDGPYTREFRRNFVFAAVKTVESVKKDEAEMDVKLAKDLGKITVEIDRGLSRPRVDSLARPAPPRLRGNGAPEISEKALKGKAVSHAICLAARQPVASRSIVHFDRLEEDVGPIAVFHFLYRSREALKQEQVIPRTPPPSSPGSDPLARLSQTEIRRMARERLAELKPNTKPEPSGRPLKRELNEVFDLTNEDDDVGQRPSKRRRGTVEVISLLDD